MHKLSTVFLMRNPRKKSSGGAHASGVLAIAFCERELLRPLIALRMRRDSNKSSSPQNAATSTLQACAPRIAATSRPRGRRYIEGIMVTIETIRNGPYIVTGEVDLIDAALSFRGRIRIGAMECPAAGFIGWLGLSRRSDTDQG